MGTAKLIATESQSITLKHKRTNKSNGLVENFDLDTNVNTLYTYKSDSVSSDGFTPTAWTAGTVETPVKVVTVDYSDSQYDHERQFAFQHPLVSNRAFVTGASGLSVLVDGNLRTAAVTKAQANLASQKLNVGVALAEAHKTATTVVDVATDLAKGLIAIKHRDVRALKRLFGGSAPSTELSRRWLQYQYGIKPLVNDVAGAIDVHNSGIANSAGSLLVLGRGTAKRVYEDAWQNYTSSTKFKSTGRQWASVNDSYLHAKKLLGLDTSQVLWELTPFSFVVDWIVPIGTILQARSAPAGLTFVTGAYSQKSVVTSSAEVGNNIPGSNTTVSLTATMFTREQSGGFIFPAVYTKELTPRNLPNFLALLGVLTDGRLKSQPF
jgi:hypothetical protein